VEGRIIFIDDRDRVDFLAMMRRMEVKFSVRIITYCLMGNHFHFAIQVGPIPLSTAMHWLLSSYCTMFNHRHDRIGHVFGGRHDEILCTDDRYLVGLIRYIHMNPVRAGLVDSPGHWPWSSYVPGEEIGTEVMDFDPWPKSARKVDTTKPDAAKAALDVIGSTVTASTGVSVEHLRSYRRTIEVIAARKLFVKDSNLAGHSLSSTARWLNISPRTAQRYMAG